MMSLYGKKAYIKLHLKESDKILSNKMDNAYYFLVTKYQNTVMETYN